MYAQPNVVARRRYFYYRCRVPVDLVARVGRKELSRSLRTTDRSLGRLRAAILSARTQRLWWTIRRAMNREEIDRLFRAWLDEELANDDL